MTEIGKILNKWADRTIMNMKKILEAEYTTRNGVTSNKVNTKQTLKSIKKNIDETNKTFSITYIQYGKYVDSGRRAGAKPPPYRAIMEWLLTNHGRSFLNSKKIKIGSKTTKGQISQQTLKSVAIGVAKGISKHGIKPVRFLNQESKIKNVNNVYGSLKTDLQKAMANTKII